MSAIKKKLDLWRANLCCSLEMFHAVAVNVVVRPNWLLKLMADHHPWTLGCGTARKDHDACPRIGEGRLACVH
jgi:hypothetical protein